MGIRMTKKSKEIEENLANKIKELSEIKKNLLSEYLDNVIFDDESVYAGFHYEAVKDKLIATGFTDEAVNNGKLSIPPLFDAVEFTEFSLDNTQLMASITEIDFGLIREITKNALSAFSGLKRVQGAGVMVLGEEALANKFFLESVDLPNLCIIGNSAFKDSTIREVNFPHVGYIDDYAFAGTHQLLKAELLGYSGYTPEGEPTEGLFMDSTVVEVKIYAARLLGKNCFLNCTGLKELKIFGVSLIDTCALEGCTNLSSLYVGRLGAISEFAFNYCDDLSFIYTMQSLEDFRSADKGWKIQGQTELDVIKRVIDAGNMTFDYKIPEVVTE